MTTFRIKFITPAGHIIYRSTIAENKAKADFIGAIYQQRNWRRGWVYKGIETS